MTEWLTPESIQKIMKALSVWPFSMWIKSEGCAAAAAEMDLLLDKANVIQNIRKQVILK